jgi:hypothetical protein
MIELLMKFPLVFIMVHTHTCNCKLNLNHLTQRIAQYIHDYFVISIRRAKQQYSLVCHCPLTYESYCDFPPLSKDG